MAESLDRIGTLKPFKCKLVTKRNTCATDAGLDKHVMTSGDELYCTNSLRARIYNFLIAGDSAALSSWRKVLLIAAFVWEVPQDAFVKCDAVGMTCRAVNEKGNPPQC